MDYDKGKNKKAIAVTDNLDILFELHCSAKIAYFTNTNNRTPQKRPSDTSWEHIQIQKK